MSRRGLYLVGEGPDGVGKSTVLARVHAELATRLPGEVFRLTRHPGATPLGAHLRQLVKYPESVASNISIDPLSAQLLMVVDASNFVRRLLEPSLAEGVHVVADRSNAISMIVYGFAEGLEYAELERLAALVNPPKADRVYVLNCAFEIARARLLNKLGSGLSGFDRFESKGEEFNRRVHRIYASLTTWSTE